MALDNSEFQLILSMTAGSVLMIISIVQLSRYRKRKKRERIEEMFEEQNV